MCLLIPTINHNRNVCFVIISGSGACLLFWQLAGFQLSACSTTDGCSAWQNAIKSDMADILMLYRAGIEATIAVQLALALQSKLMLLFYRRPMTLTDLCTQCCSLACCSMCHITSPACPFMQRLLMLLCNCASDICVGRLFASLQMHCMAVQELIGKHSPHDCTAKSAL